jgi:hypothetical protein
MLTKAGAKNCPKGKCQNEKDLKMFTSQLFLKQCLRAAELKMKKVFDF